ncbi:RibD family protein [Thioalkalivibrio sp.]|uniref:RibD family protein n=1 Tax=Thioalkalivibrio sp. TaxID=2093813 RepID=UPI0039762FBC
MSHSGVQQLYPPPHRERSLEGLYLEHPMRHPDQHGGPFVYTNFISSLDGRIAVDSPQEGRLTAPKGITNARDWRLFQELAARADALIVGASFLRNLSAGTSQHKMPLSDDPIFADLHDWRRDQGLPPQPALVVLSRGLNLPLKELCGITDRPVYLAVGKRVDQEDLKRVESTGLRIVTAGRGDVVEGKALIEVLANEGFRRIYSIAGPRVLHTLLSAGVLHRLYLTHFHRVLGGRTFDTLLEGEPLDTRASFVPEALYYDPQGDQGVGQFFAVYDLFHEDPVSG